MKTKNNIVRLISIFLLLGMLICMFAACGDKEPPPEEDLDDSENRKEVNLPFGRENYNKELNILYYTNTMSKNYHFDDVTEAGDVVKEALIERRLLVEDYLGVQVIGKSAGTTENSVPTTIMDDVLNGSDNYQIAMTHVYIGVDTLSTGGYLRDLYEFDDISLNEDYWNVSAMESLEIGKKAYFGSSKFLVSDVCAILFNKDMYGEYQITENPYDLVREGKWTLAKFMEIAAKVAVENGDLQGTKDGTYGLGARADWEFLPLVDSCEVEWLTGSAYKTLNMSAKNERYQTLYEKVEEMCDADWSYMYNFGDNDNKVTIADGRFLFTMEPLKSTPNYLDSEVKFGVLPYPKYDEIQKDYHTNDFGGLFCVPVSVKEDNLEMVGKTLECLSYFSPETISIAYYDRLLGYRVANESDDREMLDTYIFGKISLNPAINYCGKANVPLGILVYTIPKMLRAKLNGTTVTTITVNWEEHKVAAQGTLDNTINK